MEENQKTGEKPKKVTFYERVRRRNVETLLDEDHNMLWYSSKDYEMARDKERTLRCYIRKTEQNEANLNAQGILTLEEAARKRIYGASATSAVFEAQETQELASLTGNGVRRKPADFALDGEEIAKAYRPYSQAALAQARHRAMTHEAHIQAILSDPTEKLISALPNRQSRQSLLSPASRRRQSRMTLLRPGKRFQRPTVFLTGTSTPLVSGVTTSAV